MNKTIYKSALLGESYTRYIHQSGLEIYIFDKKMSASFALFGTKYGSIHNSFTLDGSEITVPDGIAHFLEHKLFVCEDGSDAFEHFSALGADANAYTSFNRTAYHFSCSENFEESLCELVDFVTHPYFTRESVASEIGIISEEIAMYDDHPGDRCFYGMLEGMYKDHSIRRNICGSKQSIRQITPDTLYACYGAFYRPDNMVLVLCGDINEERVLRLIDEHLPQSFVAGAAKKKNENIGESSRACSEYVNQRMQVSKPLFSIGFKDTCIPADAAKRQRKDALMALVCEALFSRSGDFYASLFERELISPAFSYGYTITESFAYCSLSGEADDPERVLREVESHIDDTLRKGLDREEFERAKRVLYAESVRLFDSVDSIGNALFSCACEQTEIFTQAQLFGELSYDDAQDMLKQFFTDYSATLSVVSPI